MDRRKQKVYTKVNIIIDNGATNLYHRKPLLILASNKHYYMLDFRNNSNELNFVEEKYRTTIKKV
jgi:hypothetical protein